MANENERANNFSESRCLSRNNRFWCIRSPPPKESAVCLFLETLPSDMANRLRVLYIECCVPFLPGSCKFTIKHTGLVSNINFPLQFYPAYWTIVGADHLQVCAFCLSLCVHLYFSVHEIRCVFTAGWQCKISCKGQNVYVNGILSRLYVFCFPFVNFVCHFCKLIDIFMSYWRRNNSKFHRF